MVKTQMGRLLERLDYLPHEPTTVNGSAAYEV